MAIKIFPIRDEELCLAYNLLNYFNNKFEHILVSPIRLDIEKDEYKHNWWRDLVYVDEMVGMANSNQEYDDMGRIIRAKNSTITLWISKLRVDTDLVRDYKKPWTYIILHEFGHMYNYLTLPFLAAIKLWNNKEIDEQYAHKWAMEKYLSYDPELHSQVGYEQVRNEV